MYLTEVGFGLLSGCNLCFGDTGEFRVNHDAAAVFADDYFLVHLDFHLLLWRNAVEAPAAGITLDIYYAKAVAGVVADTLECFECALVDSGLDFLCAHAEALFVLTGLGYDFIKLGLFLLEDMLAVGEFLLGSGDIGVARVDGTGEFVEVLF